MIVHKRYFSLFLSLFMLFACENNSDSEAVNLAQPASPQVGEATAGEPVSSPAAVVLPEPPVSKIESMGPYQVDVARDCDGFPRANVTTPAGICVGIVASADTPTGDGGRGLRFPRDILILEPSSTSDKQVLIVDMGGWSENRGRLLSLRNDKIETVLSSLNLPHSIELGPTGELFIAEANQIIRLRPTDDTEQAYEKELVIKNLPYKAGDKLHLHPLKAFAFQDDKTLWINSGSVSDRCLANRTESECREPANTAVVLKFTLQGEGWMIQSGEQARGLRNSMGLTAHQSGTVLQAGNGSDFKDANLPPEELNVVQAGKHYGWPYCYAKQGIDPDWVNAAFKCASEEHTKPVSLLPPHGAPLDLMYVPAGTLGYAEEKLIVPLHGYRETGHRVLVFDVDSQGIPVGEPVELVSGWAADDTKPRGAPVGVALASDGSIWGVEDKNKTVFRIAKDNYGPAPWGESGTVQEQQDDPAYAMLHKEIFVPHCAACHAEFTGTAGESVAKLQRSRWIGANATVPFYERLTAPPRQMPPAGPLAKEEINAIGAGLNK